jgi:hypothetical protein
VPRGFDGAAIPACCSAPHLDPGYGNAMFGCGASYEACGAGTLAWGCVCPQVTWFGERCGAYAIPPNSTAMDANGTVFHAFCDPQTGLCECTTGTGFDDPCWCRGTPTPGTCNMSVLNCCWTGGTPST